MKATTAGALAALQAPKPPLVLLVEMGFSPVIRLATAAVTINWSGFDWLGAGPMGAVEPVRNSAGDAQALRFVLSNVPTELLSLALGTSARNKTCVLRLAILNPDTHAIEQVDVVGTYVLDQMTISEGGNAGAVAVTAQPRARLFARPKPLRYTDADQQRLYPGDRCLEYLVSQSTHQDIWPAASWGRK